MVSLIQNIYTVVPLFCSKRAAVLLKLIFAVFIVFLQLAAGPVQALENEKMSETRIKLS